ncbi:short-chain dehydrogenase [Candidatus Marsarchaeota G1 archaeon BE_D]|jgi:Dehydrogenases with different specificities (related to short-chain alcohol dehydrogenases)|uniref:Short-chain dehydrogenase n=2 Tax=Candidatus Marsarchaeota TaxID=1978152 RepID=A0A2R6C2Q1_9ARCH|nr:MAG: short-chain dehydrogenase [Candidatus Marsarchaeota G1 archaeon BE_D]PSO05138.1 MAG: short-chain dehydrogenase [Candidatus Marsarchaeota G2 archaeon ECH_B_SAG-G06]
MARVAVVTGSGRGIGLAIALALAKNGFKIVLNAKRHAEEGEQALRLVKSFSDAHFVQADVATEQGALTLIDESIKVFGGVDVLVNNAGVGIAKPLVQTEEALWDKMINANLKSTYLCCRFSIPHMLKNSWGRIVNITSVAGLHGAVHLCAYSAAKAGVIGLTKALAAELESTGITVNAVAAGLVKTKMGESLLRYLGVEEKEWANRFTLTHKLIEPEEVGTLVGYLVSEDAKNVTGQVFVIDSGSTIKQASYFGV